VSINAALPLEATISAAVVGAISGP